MDITIGILVIVGVLYFVSAIAATGGHRHVRGYYVARRAAIRKTRR